MCGACVVFWKNEKEKEKKSEGLFFFESVIAMFCWGKKARYGPFFYSKLTSTRGTVFMSVFFFFSFYYCFDFFVFCLRSRE